MKQTIIALIPPKEEQKLYYLLGDKDFLIQAKSIGMILSMSELCKLWNTDEIHVKDWFIRTLEVDSEFRLT